MMVYCPFVVFLLFALHDLYTSTASLDSCKRYGVMITVSSHIQQVSVLDLANSRQRREVFVLQHQLSLGAWH